jgi:hypothetical protein
MIADLATEVLATDGRGDHTEATENRRRNDYRLRIVG